MVDTLEAIHTARSALEDSMTQLRSMNEMVMDLAVLAGLSAPAWVGVVNTHVWQIDDALSAYLGAVHQHIQPDQAAASVVT